MRVSQITSEKRLQALHETGHAIVAHALGYSVDCLVLTEGNASVRGYVSFRDPTAIPPAVLTQPNGPLKYELMARTTSITILLSGKGAELRFGGREESKGWSGDANEIALEMAAIKTIAPIWDNREGELLHISQTLSDSILNRNAEFVRNISEALIAKGSLSHEDLTTLLATVAVEDESFKIFQYAVLRHV